MRSIRLGALLVPGIVLVTGCGGDVAGPADENLVQFIGAWRATKFEYISQDTQARVNLSSLGATVTLTINPAGDWTMLVTRPGLIRYDVSTGNMSVDGDRIVFLWDGYDQPVTFVYDLSDDTLTMSTSEAQYDFDTDGAVEPADLDMVLLRI